MGQANFLENVNYSNIKPYSLGVVACNMSLNQSVITVTPISILPMTDGEIQDGMQPYQAEFKNGNQQQVSVSVDTSITLTAKWLCRDINLMTPPNIRRGAKVMIYQESNTGYFYWEPYTNTDNYQKLETKVYGYSNTQNEQENPNPNNTWTQGVSTHTKMVNLIHTTKSDGEKFSYDINVDVASGTVNIHDDIGNEFKIFSGENRLRMASSEGAYIEIRGRDIYIHADNLYTKINNTIKEEAPIRNGEYTTDTSRAANVNLLADVAVAGAITGVVGESGSGDMSTSGNYTSTGSITVDGHIHAKGNITSDSNIEAKGLVKGNPVEGCPH